MDNNSGLKPNTDLTFIEFDDQQKVKIGVALQAVADQMVPKLDQQLLSNYEVDGGSSCVEITERKVETLIPSANMDSTCASSLRNNDKVVIKTEISNQVLLESSNDLSSYLVKEEPHLQKFEVDPPAPDNETSAWSEDLYCPQEIEPINIQYISDEGSGLSKECGSEIIVGDESIDSIESNSQDEDDKQNVEQKMIRFIRHICPECGVDCGPYSKWKEHTETQHTITWLSFISETILDGESCYQCFECKKKLNKRSSFRLLQEHHIKHLPHSSYLKCQFCEKRFQALSYVLHHIKRKHAKLIGPSINNKYSNPNFKYIKIFCPICQESQLNVRLWQQHLTEKHDYENKIKSEVTQIDENVYSCNFCQKKISRAYIKIHMLSHLLIKSFQCILCKKTDTYLQGAVSHIRRIHFCSNKNKLLECSFCKSTFTKKSLLENHYQKFHKRSVSKYMVNKFSTPRIQDETDTESVISNSLNTLDSNQLLPTSPYDLSTYNTVTKEEPQLQEFESEYPASFNETEAVADQSAPKLHRQLLSSYEVDGSRSCVEDTQQKVETLITSASSSDLSNYLTKEDPQLQKFEINLPASDDETSAWSENIYSFKGIESTNMEYISDESNSQDEDDSQNIEKEAISIDYNSYMHHLCPECGVDCGPYSKWKLHTEMQHTIPWLKFISKVNVDGESYYQCLECKKKLNNKIGFRLLQEHHIRHMPHSYYMKCHFCDKRFQALHYVYRHIKQQHTKLTRAFLKKQHSNPNFRYIKIFCPICQESQLNITLWQKHLTEKHDYENKTKSDVTQIDKNMYSCNLCQKKTPRDHIEIHMLSHLPNKSFQCSLCKKYTTYLKATVGHVSRIHFCSNKNKLLECSFCKTTFAKKSLLENHYQNVHKKVISEVIKYPPGNHDEIDSESGTSYPLNQQPDSDQLQLKTPTDLSTYNTLIKDEPQLDKLEIANPTPLDETENLSCSNESDPLNMRKISDEESELIENKTNEKDDKNIIYSVEMDSQDKEDDNQNIEQETASDDNNHLIHYICPECGEDCGPYSQWKLHTETQHAIAWLKFISKTCVDGESYYQCLECNLKLSRKMKFTLLQEHHIKHMLHKYYLKCSSCDKRFKTRCAINSHIKRMHVKLELKKKPNTNLNYIKIFCPFCQQSQSNIKQWRKHITEKHDYANKAKSQVTQLNESSYSCQLCLQRIRRDHIKNHMLIHESKKSFQCTLCKKYDTQLSSAVQHISRKHSSTLFGIAE